MNSDLISAYPKFPAASRRGVWPWEQRESAYHLSLPAGKQPRISIITPSFNHGQFIEETIRSVLLQGYPNLEYIIIDGGSTDNTVEVIKKYAPWLAYWVSESDRGQSHAINKGLDRATGDIVAWLNADDVYLPGALHHVANEFIRNRLDWIVGITAIADANLKEVDRFIPQLNSGHWKVRNYKTHGWLDFVMTHQSGTALPQLSSFWSREALLKVGCVDESFKYAMDHDLYGKLARAGYRPRLIPQTLACFRSHQQQKTSEFPLVFWKEELHSAQKWQQEELTILEKQALVKYVAWFTWLIRWEWLTTVTSSKRLFALAWEGARIVKRKLMKIKNTVLLGDNSSTFQLKGIVSKEVIARYLPQNPVIVEAGAHIGLDTEELAKYFPEGKIHAFEPVPDLFLQLSERVRTYKNVYCYPVALSSQVEEAVMYVSSGISDGSSSLLPPKEHLTDHPDVKFVDSILVECTTLDLWAKNNTIGKVDLLWLDLQGNELNVLKASLAVLENVCAIYTEVNLKEVYEGAPLYEELREWLESHDFIVEVEEIPWEDGGNVLFIRKPALQ